MIHFIEVYDLGEVAVWPSDTDEQKYSMWIGAIKIALRTAWHDTSSDEHCVVVKKKSQVSLKVKKDFSAGRLNLVALTNTVGIMDSTKVKASSKNMISLGELYTSIDDKSMVGVVRPSNQFGKVSQKQDVQTKAKDTYLVAFWACADSESTSKANAAISFEDVTVKCNHEAVKVKVPVIKNTRALKKNEEVIILKSEINNDDDENIAEEAPPKRARTGKGGGRGRAKAKVRSSARR